MEQIIVMNCGTALSHLVPPVVPEDLYSPSVFPDIIFQFIIMVLQMFVVFNRY